MVFMDDEVAVMTAESVLTPEQQKRAVSDELAQRMVDQIGTVKLTPDQIALATVHATLDTIEVKPSGEIYVPGVAHRTVLNKVFAPAGWGVRHGQPLLDIREKDAGSILYLSVYLVVGRCTRCSRSSNACRCDGPIVQACVASHIGAQAYHPRNARMSYDDALEGALTNGLGRCVGKSLGSYSECWDPRWSEHARSQVCVRVQVLERDNRVVYRWRRKDRLPLDGEKVTPKKPEPVVKPTPVVSPVDEPLSEIPAVAIRVTDTGEVIGQIRRNETVTGTVYYVVITDQNAERLTDDERIVRDLETAKSQGRRVAFVDEVVETRRGPVKRILSYHIL